MFRALLLGLSFATAGAGCGALSHIGQQSTIVITEGCMVYVEGVSYEMAQQMVRTWQIDEGCEVKVNSSKGNKNAVVRED